MLRKDLKKYSFLDGCSFGDYLMFLYNISEWKSDYMSDELEQAIIKEIQNTIKYVKENTIIIETEIHPPSYKTEELEWI